MSDKSQKTDTEVSSRKRWRKRLADAKKRHRPSLKDWTRDGFAGDHSTLQHL